MADGVEWHLARQLGLITLDQTIECGMSRATRQRRCSSGEWDRPQPNVYRHAAYPRTREQRILAAVLSAGRGAATSHRAATAAWGSRHLDTSLVELAIPEDRNVMLHGAVLHRIADLEPRDVTMLGSLPITTRARTLVDLGAVVRPALVRRVLEQWLSEKQVTVPQVRAQLDRVARQGRAGAGVLREILDTRALQLEASDSDAEVVLAEALRAHGVPPPVYHFLISVGNGRVYEIDFAYPESMLLIEVDGYSSHTTPEAFESDPVRDNVLGDIGYMVRRYTRRMVLSRTDAVVCEIDHWRRARAHLAS